MIYDIRHLTTYTYEVPVTYARCTLRLVPCDAPGQWVISSRLEVRPAPAKRSERTSFFGTRVTSLTVEATHTEFEIEVNSQIDVARTSHAGGQAPAWEGAREEAFALDTLAPSSPAHYLYPSRLIAPTGPLTEYAKKSFPEGRLILDGAADLMGRINSEFVYEPKSTAVSTPLLEAFERRRGVCQDFAHIMIAGLRGIGLPAAYVSGYIRTVPPPGKPRLQGADATHAWVSVWCGRQAGWIGLDPTNRMLVGNDHIVLAVGRDYTDVSPIDGIIVGSGSQELDVEVDVTPRA